MRCVVFSDIHGNVAALKSMLQQLKKEKADLYIFCGDVVGYFFHQKEVIKYLQCLPRLCAVMGNHDFYYLNSLASEEKRQFYNEKYGKSYLNTLSDREVDFLKNLPEVVELHLENKKILVTHGSPERHLEGRVYPDTVVDELFYHPYDFVILGHTHYQMYRRLDKTVLLNPGSLGQPRDGKGYSYCILDTKTGKCRFQTVDIDQAALVWELVEAKENKKLVQYLKGKMGGVV